MDVHQQGSESPPVRSTILGNLLRGRRQSQSHERETSPDPPSPMMPQGAGGGFSQMLRRRRSGGVGGGAGGAAQPSPVAAAPAPSPTTASAPIHQPNGSIALTSCTAPSSGVTHRIRLVPHLDTRRSLKFDAITRDMREGDQPVRIGRFTERNPASAAHANATTAGKVAFKSKVVSRAHAQVWVEAGGKFYVRDTKSSSGTFLNHVRLSPANTESAARPVRDGDILQLGVDYQGGTEDIYKSVKIRIEVGREWQGHKNVFNTSALKNLKSLATPITPSKSGKSNNIPDCCICLFAVTIRQALFIAPCSHTFHYKCIRPLLESHHPAFSCPLCRTFADLDEDVEVELDVAEESEPEDDDSGKEKVIIPDVAAKQEQREERERERERDAGAETEVETDVHRDMSASRRRSRMEMMEEEEDRFNTNPWIMDTEAIPGPTVISHVGGDGDVIMHVEDKNTPENSS